MEEMGSRTARMAEELRLMRERAESQGAQPQLPTNCVATAEGAASITRSQRADMATVFPLCVRARAISRRAAGPRARRGCP